MSTKNKTTKKAAHPKTKANRSVKTGAKDEAKAAKPAEFPIAADAVAVQTITGA